MKTIVCFGDSNTYGKDGATSKRFARNVRWPGILKDHLGKDFEIIEEGLIGRTTVHNDPVLGKMKNGKKYLGPCLASHSPVDLVIFMLGTSDAKNQYSLYAEDIAAGMEILVKMAKNSETGPNGSAPHILLLTPFFGPDIEKIEKYHGVHKRMKDLDGLYWKISEKYGCSFLETQKFVQTTGSDHLHLDAEGHKKLGTAAAAMVNRIFKM